MRSLILVLGIIILLGLLVLGTMVMLYLAGVIVAAICGVFSALFI